jgi:hypothetical protein
MQIGKWHVGKLVILWLWGGVPAALCLNFSQSVDVKSAPFRYLASLLAGILLLAALSVVTWKWFSAKE